MTVELLPAPARPALPVVVRQTTAANAVAGLDEHDRWHLLAGRWLLGYSSPHTRRAYASDLSQWRRWCHALGTEPLAAGRDHVAAWQTGLAAQGRRSATIARKTATLAAFYAYLVDEDVIGRSPVRGRRPRAADDPTSTGLTEREAARLLDAAETDGPRSAVLVGLLYLLGLRVGEALGARAEDLGWERGHRTLTVTRKGGARARLPLPTALAAQVDHLVTSRAAGPVLATRTGRPMDPKQAWETVRRLGRAAGLPQAATLHPHDLRHGHATASLDANVPLRDVQDSLGHADPRTTRRYDRARGRIDRHPGSLLAARLAPHRGSDGVAEGGPRNL
jgi:integrase/recombinase XerD